MTRQQLSEKLFLFGLIVLVVSLPLSIFGMSNSQAIIIGAWLIGGNIVSKIKTAFSNPVVLVLIGVYVMHLIGALYSTDINYLSRDLRIKLPLLLMPIVFSTSPALRKKTFQTIMIFFVLAVFASTIVSMGVLYDIFPHKHPITDIRNISVFISHIRLSLLICIAVFTCGWLMAHNENRFLKMACTALIVWFLIFMNIMEAMTGFVVLFFASVIMVFLFFLKNKSAAVKISVTAIIILLPVAGAFYIKHEASKIFKPFTKSIDQLDMLTANGRPYHHSIENPLPELPYLNPKMQENGNPLCIYVNIDELKNAWNERSDLNFDGKDLMGHEIKYTIARYMSSKSLRKDSVGVYTLSQEDIRAIEKGIPNVEYRTMGSLKIRLHKTIMEYYSYKFGDNPSGRSMQQRFEFWKAGTNIFLQNFLTGVGTGDVQQAFDREYERTHSPLSMERRLRAHNQYLTLAITFGIFGFFYFVFSLLYPYFKMKKQTDFFYTGFLLIALLSMFTEDTLETQAGVTFFTFFNCFFLFLNGHDKRVTAV